MNELLYLHFDLFMYVAQQIAKAQTHAVDLKS